MSYQIYRTSLNQVNGGRPSAGAVDPARYSGRTSCYVAHIKGRDNDLYAYSRKRDAISFAHWVDAHNEENLGDLDLAWTQSGDPRAINAKLVGITTLDELGR